MLNCFSSLLISKKASNGLSLFYDLNHKIFFEAVIGDLLQAKVRGFFGRFFEDKEEEKREKPRTKELLSNLYLQGFNDDFREIARS